MLRYLPLFHLLISFIDPVVSLVPLTIGYRIAQFSWPQICRYGLIFFWPDHDVDQAINRGASIDTRSCTTRSVQPLVRHLRCTNVERVAESNRLFERPERRHPARRRAPPASYTRVFTVRACATLNAAFAQVRARQAVRSERWIIFLR
jgi:hypothetical protein